MSVTVWKGLLTFGLVSIPVRLFRAARRETVNLHQLYRKASPAPPPRSAQAPYLVEPEESVPELTPVARIRQGAFTQEEQAPLPPSQIVKGFEYEPERYVVIEKEDLDKIAPKTATEMQILEFVTMSEIDPVYFETSYYVVPEEAGEKAYALLFDALRESGYVALAEFAMRRRQHAVIIRPAATGIIAHTMFYTDEIRKTDEFRADLSAVTKKERDLAVALIGAMAAPFEPEKFKDTYREKLEQLIAAKIEGREVVAEAPAKAAPAVDIMEALQKSLAMKRKPVGSAPEPAREGKKRSRR
jgi:DNA end-binding protein Ku